TVASMPRPRSRSGKSCRAALMVAEVRLAAARIESGAAAAPPARVSVMAGFLERAGTGRTIRRSPLTRQLKPFPARLYLSSLTNKKGTGAVHRSPNLPNGRSHPARLCHSAASSRCGSFSSILPILVVGEEFWQWVHPPPPLATRRNGETQRLRQPA